MSNVTKASVAEMWFDKAYGYMDLSDTATLGMVLDCAKYYAMAIKNTESDDERRKMEERVDDAFARFTSKVLKKALENNAENFDNFGSFGDFVSALIIENGMMVFANEVKYTSLFPVSHTHYYVKECLDFIKLSASKTERLKNNDTDEYMKKNVFRNLFVHGSVFELFANIEIFYKEMNIKIDYTDMYAAWWEVLEECKKISLHTVEEAGRLNPARAAVYREAFSNISGRLENRIAETKVAYERKLFNDRKKHLAEHPEEVEKLRAELANIPKEIDAIRKQIFENQELIETVTIDNQKKQTEKVNEFDKKIQDFEAELKTLGLFKIKEKNAVKNQIEEIQKQKNAMKQKYETELLNERNALEMKNDVLVSKIEDLEKKKEDIEKLL